MTTRPRIPDRTEHCLARAIVLLEAADDLDKLYGEPKREVIEQTKARVQLVVNKNMCIPVVTVQDTNNAIVVHRKVEDNIRLNDFKSAHDIITRQALLSLIDCVDTVEPDAPEPKVIDAQGSVTTKRNAIGLATSLVNQE